MDLTNGPTKILNAPKPIKTIKIIKPYGSILAYLEDRCSGRIPISTCEPSSGGTGIRLKTPSMRLIAIKFTKIKLTTSDAGKKRKIILKPTANMKFAKGPLNPTQMISLLGFFSAQ